MHGWGVGEAVRMWHPADFVPGHWVAGYVDAEGRWVVPPGGIHASEFSEGLALADFEGTLMYVPWLTYLDTKGKVAIDKVVMKDGQILYCGACSGASDFHEGLAAAVWKNHTYFIDKTGHEVFRMENLDLGMMTRTTSLDVAFSEGLATVKQKGKVGVIDRTGRWVISPSTEPLFSFISPFHHGLAVARQYGGGAGVIDGKGETVVPFEYTSASALGNDRFLVSKSGQDGVIDARNRWVVPLSQRQLREIGSERCKLYCKEDGMLMDGEGKALFKTALKLEGKFSEGLCAMYDTTGQGGYGYMDEQGRVVFRLRRGITWLGPFRNGLAEVEKCMENGAVYSALVNKQGKIMIEDVNGP